MMKTLSIHLSIAIGMPNRLDPVDQLGVDGCADFAQEWTNATGREVVR